MSEQRDGEAKAPDLVGEWARYLARVGRPLADAASGPVGETVLRHSHDTFRRLLAQWGGKELLSDSLARTGEVAAGLKAQVEQSLREQLSALQVARSPEVTALGEQVRALDERLGRVEAHLGRLTATLNAVAATVGAPQDQHDDSAPDPVADAAKAKGDSE